MPKTYRGETWTLCIFEHNYTHNVMYNNYNNYCAPHIKITLCLIFYLIMTGYLFACLELLLPFFAWSINSAGLVCTLRGHLEASVGTYSVKQC